jgi:hypothetical protein
LGSRATTPAAPRTSRPRCGPSISSRCFRRRPSTSS